MFNANVGSSILVNSYDAGMEAAKLAMDNLNEIKMAFMYTSCEHDQEEVLKGASEVLKDVPIIGNTSFTGIITQQGFIGGNTFVGIMVISSDDLAIGIAGVEKETDAREAGQKAALDAIENSGKKQIPNYFYMVAPPGEEESYLKGITDVIGRVPCFGGSAADNTIEGKWKLFTNNGSFADGVAVAFFFTDSSFANEYTGAYRETCNSGVITKLSGKRTLVEIDGEPAIMKYSKWVSKDPSKLLGGNLLLETILAPLGVKDRLGDLVAIRHPMFGNDDFSMNIGSNLAVNTCVIQMESTTDELIYSVETALKDLKEKLGEDISALHLIHCGGRRAGIGDRINEVYGTIKKTVGTVPFIMEFTFGEYGFFDDGNNTCGGLMLSFTAFGK
ncbi:MAG: FIST C-terminal domain-containing protein [Oscillospiraceae bacterium]|nr:FIST C-terminal domain-containing protein [Oscillospiraceae bacterium]